MPLEIVRNDITKMKVDAMKIYDISQEVFGCDVYPGDAAPSKRADVRMERGDL